jgi:hypothetical protein
LRKRQLTFWEGFTAADYDNNGFLSPAEFYGALIWLNVPDLTSDDVVDFLESVDTNRGFTIYFAIYFAISFLNDIYFNNYIF